MDLNIKKLLREAIAFEGRIDEIEWADVFADVSQVCVPAEDVAKYLNKVKANARKEYKNREKFGANLPFIHAKSSTLKSKKNVVDVDYFIQKITQKPKTIVNTNDKILKSGAHNEFVYKTGLPALRGIAYDEQNDTFHYINTCPGAGACIAICYARKGNYVRYPAAYDSMTRRLNYLLNHPDLYEEQMYNEIKAKAIEHKALKGYKNVIILRWNDSGDFFAKKYVDIAENVIDRLQKDGYNVESYAYTKVADVAKDSDIQTTFSVGANPEQTRKIDLKKHKLSMVVPRELFSDLDLDRISDEKELKKRIADEYGFKLGDVISYDEMMRIPPPKTPKKIWHVIVTPKDGDDAAFRKDVKTILLIEH